MLLRELHMLLVAAGDNQPKVDVLGSATQLTEALGKFEFSEAQCYDPNEERSEEGHPGCTWRRC